MISEKIVLLVAALFAFPLTANAAPTNLISNGAFEKLSGSPTAGNEVCGTPTSVTQYGVCTAVGWDGSYQIGEGAGNVDTGGSFNIPQPHPDGGNALILEFASDATQVFNVEAPGVFTLTFQLANRSSPGISGPQTVEVLLNGNVLAGGTFTNIPATWTKETILFTAKAGSNTLTFEGLGIPGEDVTAFVNGVLILERRALNPFSGQLISASPL
jgi:hypothetical protein